MLNGEVYSDIKSLDILKIEEGATNNGRFSLNLILAMGRVVKKSDKFIG